MIGVMVEENGNVVGPDGKGPCDEVQMIRNSDFI